jgi:hypothetical protein
LPHWDKDGAPDAGADYANERQIEVQESAQFSARLTVSCGNLNELFKWTEFAYEMSHTASFVKSFD